MKVNASTLFFAALAISGVAAAPIADAPGVAQPVARRHPLQEERRDDYCFGINCRAKVKMARHEPRDQGYCVFGCEAKAKAKAKAKMARRQNTDEVARRDRGPPGKGAPNYCIGDDCEAKAKMVRRQNADQLTRRDPGKGDPEYCPNGDCWFKGKKVRRQNTEQLTRRDPGKGDPEYCPNGDCWFKGKKVRRQNTNKLVRRDPGQGDGDGGEEGGDNGDGHKAKDRREALRSDLRPVGGDPDDGGSVVEPCGDNC